MITTNIAIKGIGTYLPGLAINNEQLAEFLGISPGWIDLFVGNKYRHFAYDWKENKVKQQLVDLAEQAAQNALSQSGIDKANIDFLILSTATPDYMMPATVNLVADRLGLNNISTYELRSGCCGIMQCIDTAVSMLLSGRFTTGLLIGADTCNKQLALNKNISTLPATELINYVLFGDGAGAIVVSNEPCKNDLLIEATLNRFTGLGRSPGQIVNWQAGNYVDPGCMDEATLHEDYKAIEKFVPQMAKKTMDDLLNLLGKSGEEINYYLPPQLNGNMIDAVVAAMQLPMQKVINCVVETGNNGNALPLLQLEKLATQFKAGESAIQVSIESSKWLESGMALRKI